MFVSELHIINKNTTAKTTATSLSSSNLSNYITFEEYETIMYNSWSKKKILIEEVENIATVCNKSNSSFAFCWLYDSASHYNLIVEMLSSFVFGCSLFCVDTSCRSSRCLLIHLSNSWY